MDRINDQQFKNRSRGFPVTEQEVTYEVEFLYGPLPVKNKKNLMKNYNKRRKVKNGKR